jgi:hypothetical protein
MSTTIAYQPDGFYAVTKRGRKGVESCNMIQVITSESGIKYWRYVNESMLRTMVEIPFDTYSLLYKYPRPQY